MSKSTREKADSLAERMNKITEKFKENIESAEELDVTGNDIIEFVEEKTKEIQLYSEDVSPIDVLNLSSMVQDFKYVRETLHENTENGRRVLNSVALSLLDEDDEKKASLILSFAELNKAMADNMKLYILSYREISNIIANIDKVRRAALPSNSPQSITNNLTINSEPVSTIDILKELSKTKPGED